MSTKKKSSRRRRQSFRFPYFYLFYFLLVAFVILFTGRATDYLHDYLQDYEDAQPEYAAEEAAKIFTERRFDELFQYEDQSVLGAESRDQYVSYMNELTAGKEISWREVRSSDPDVKRYVVSLGDAKMGEFTLGKTGQTNAHGFGLWGLQSVSTDVLASTSYQITAPSTSRVYVDGVQLTADQITDAGTPILDVADNLPEGLTAPTLCTYQFSRYFGVKEVRVFDPRNRDNAVTQLSPTQWTAEFNYDDALFGEDVTARVIDVTKRLSECLSVKKYDRKKLLEVLVKDSKAYRYVKAFDTDWFRDHKSHEFLDMQLSHFVSYSEDVFSVETHYDYKITYSGGTETYPTAYRLFFQNVKGTWYMFDFELI